MRFVLAATIWIPAVASAHDVTLIPIRIQDGNNVASASGLMYSILITDGGPMKLAWDTGATYSLVQKAVIETRGLALQDGRYATDTLALGSRDFGPHRMVALDLAGAPHVDGVIGANFFARHRVCFDYGRRAVGVR